MLNLPPVVVLLFIFDNMAHEVIVHFAWVHISLTHGALLFDIVRSIWLHILDVLLSLLGVVLLAAAIVSTIAIHILVDYKSIVNFTVPLLLDKSIA